MATNKENRMNPMYNTVEANKIAQSVRSGPLKRGTT
jgi:hypothetical protein